MKNSKFKWIIVGGVAVVIVTALFLVNSLNTKGALMMFKRVMPKASQPKMQQFQVPSQVQYCYVDSVLKIGAFVYDGSIGITDVNVTTIQANDKASCKNAVTAKGYRFADYYKTHPDFAVVCTTPCSIPDIAFMNAAFEGMIKGVAALKDGIGYLPKQKMEFHLGQDGDCFINGYGDHPTGYASFNSNGNGIILSCNSDYFWYLDSQNHPWARNLDYERSIASQTLTIHEPIHGIFSEYVAQELSPEYKIQEAFCKGVSLTKVGLATGYGDAWFTSGQYSIDNPPPENTPAIYSFLIYSLNKRFGFEAGPLTRQFFDLYRNDKRTYGNGNERVKAILDKVLGQDTSASFKDVGVTFEQEPISQETSSP